VTLTLAPNASAVKTMISLIHSKEKACVFLRSHLHLTQVQVSASPDGIARVLHIKYIQDLE
jgi:hypothetical protein